MNLVFPPEYLRDLRLERMKMRNGDWKDDSKSVRALTNFYYIPESRLDFTGFRPCWGLR
jgi:hypothetical protein